MARDTDLTRRLNDRLTNSDVCDSVDPKYGDTHVVVDESDVGEFFKATRELDLERDSIFRGGQGNLRGWVSEK